MRIVCFALGCLFATAAPALAQRRPAAPPPVDLLFGPDGTPGASPYRWRVDLTASAEVEIAADRRLVWLEVRPEGARRALRCESPARPRRPDPTRVRTLRAGETWAEWFDIRSVCWGAALRAFAGGANVTAHFGARTGRFVVASNAAGAWRDLVQPSSFFGGRGETVEPLPAVVVSLADADAVSARRLAFRVRVRSGSGPVRAWVRPDRFAFRVLSPDGSSRTCRISRGGGAPIPDVFARLGSTRGADRVLDAGQFCGPNLFASEGIYEVTPILELDASGAAWRMQTPLGVFEGAPAAVRVRSGDRGYVEHPIGAAR